MRWEDGRQSENVEDRRGMGPSVGMPRGIQVGGMGLIGLIVVALLAMFLGVNPGTVIEDDPPPTPPPARAPGGGRGPSVGPVPGPVPRTGTRPDDLKKFVSVVLADTEDTWSEIFRRSGRAYEPPRLVLFSGEVQSACGFAGAATGPFYCPIDEKVYLDLQFFEDLRARFGAPGDFAQAYVITHEVGHHVQTLLGITQKVHAARSRMMPEEANALAVRMELQADCFAGVWANRADQARQILEAGDVEEGLTAAAAIGDDRIQRRTRGYVVPESFTHGSSAQRARWFRQGLERGDPSFCDTFRTDRL